jgi:hypothetical protein
MNTTVRLLRSSHALKGWTVLLTLPIHLQGLEREVGLHPIVVGVKGTPIDGDEHTNIIHTNTLCPSPAHNSFNPFCAAFFCLI